MTYTKEETKWYNQHREFTCRTLNITINQYNYIRRIGNAINTLDCDNCNGEITGYISKLHLLLDKLNDYLSLENLPCYTFHQSDPRGASLYLSKQPIDRDSYNSTAECIY